MNPLCVIICAGDFDPSDLPQKRPFDLFIAADGGAKRLEEAGVSPDVFIGDLDSLPSPPECPETVTLPVRKDDTDSAAALKHAIAKGYSNILLLGALGGKRLSHTLANIQLLSYARAHGANAVIRGAGTELKILLAGESADIPQGCRYFSLFSLGESAAVNLRGALFPGEGLVLRRDFPLGVSNEPLSSPRAEVTRGEVLLVTEE